MQANDTVYGQSGFWTWDEPMWERLRWLRENDPVHWSEPDGLFVVSRFEDVAMVSKSHRLFCSGQGVLPIEGIKLSLIDEDEPRHSDLRRLINRGFTPRMVRKLETVFESIVDESIDRVAGRGECAYCCGVCASPSCPSAACGKTRCGGAATCGWRC